MGRSQSALLDDRSIKCDPVFGQNTEARIFELACANERRPDSLPERNGYCYKQGLSTRAGQIYSSGKALRLLGPERRSLDRLENSVG